MYHAARSLGRHAADTVGIDPDRISLTVTLRTARHTVITAAGVTPEPASEPAPRIRTAVCNPRDLQPTRRRPRLLPRRVKRTISPYAYNKTRHNKPVQHVTTTFTVTPPATDVTTSPEP